MSALLLTRSLEGQQLVGAHPARRRVGLGERQLGLDDPVLTVPDCVRVVPPRSWKVSVAWLGRFVPRVFALTSSTVALKCRTSFTSWPVVLAYWPGKVAVIVLAGDSAMVMVPDGPAVEGARGRAQATRHQQLAAAERVDQLRRPVDRGAFNRRGDGVVDALPDGRLVGARVAGLGDRRGPGLLHHRVRGVDVRGSSAAARSVPASRVLHVRVVAMSWYSVPWLVT